MASSAVVLILFLVFFSGGFGEGIEDAFKEQLTKMNISGNDMGKCGLDLAQMGRDLRGLKLSWAWRMFDATSKLRSGIGLLSDDIGQFDQCVGSSNDDGTITGKYCLGSFYFSAADEQFDHLYDMKQIMRKHAAALTSSAAGHPITWAACLPSSCNSDSFELVFNSVLQRISKQLDIKFTEEKCYTMDDDTKLSTGAITTIIIFALIFLVMILSTCYDLFCQYFRAEPNQLCLAFSIYTNSGKLFTINKNNNQLECLNGLKFYSMLWVLLGHTYSLGLGAPLYNYLDIITWADKLHSMLIVSGTLSVDTFFVVGGALVTYVYMQSMEKGKKFNLIIYYLHRYIRLTPALAAFALVVATVYPYLGSGPNWSNVHKDQKMCQDIWWATIFYFQNYLDRNELCVGHSWYLAVDMQLYILSPLIFYILKRFPKQTIIGLTAVILGICGLNFGLAWSNHYLALLSNIYGDSTDFLTHFYVKTHNRANTWLTGVLVGYIIHQIKLKKLNLRLNKIVVFVTWIFCLASLLVCIFIGHDSLRTPEYQQWGNSLYIALIRQYWAIGISWIIVVCISGYGGPINWFLSWPIYQVFNKFAYSIYIVHYMVITLWFASTKSPIYFSDLMMGYFFWGNLCFTCIISYFWVLAFESPVIILEKMLLKKLHLM